MIDYTNPQGKLIDIIKQVDVSTIQHAREIQKDRIKNKDLRGMSFWTADFPLYVMDGKEAVLYFGNRDNNLFFRNVETAVNQIRDLNSYFPENSDIESVINSESTYKVVLSDLELIKADNEWSYFEITPNNFDNLTPVQRSFAEKIHGQGKDFLMTMGMLADDGDIKTANIYTLNPEYVKNTLAKTSMKSLANGSFLDYFDSSCDFMACDWGVDDDFRRLRGVEVGETDVQKNPVSKNIKPLINPWDIDIPTIENKILDYKVK